MSSSNIHSLNPEQKARVASVSQDMDDNVFISEEARQRNKDEINQHMQEIKTLDERLEQIEATSKTTTEKQAAERELRLKKKQLMEIVTNLSVKRQVDEFTTQDQAIKKTEEVKTQNEIKIPVTELTAMKLDDSKKQEYYRNAVIAKNYKSNVKTIHDEIEKFMKVPSSQLTEEQRDERQLVVKSKVETLKIMVSEYRKYNEDMTKLCDREYLQIHLEDLQEVLMMSNSLTAKIQADDELNKKRLALVKSEQLEGVKLSKFSGQGDQRYLNYYGFYREFQELVMQKAYSDSTKLRYLKQYLEGDALDIVKNYHAGSELAIAYKALDDVYGRSDMVIRECIKGIQKLPRLTSDHNTRANKTFLYKITTNLIPLDVITSMLTKMKRKILRS